MFAPAVQQDRLRLEQEGMQWFRAALPSADLDLLDDSCRLGGAPGARLNMNDGLRQAVGNRSRLTQLARNLLPDAKPVRIVAFDKSLAANWLVPWHQDRVIAVAKRQQATGFRNWSCKAGNWHVEPPIELLQGMLFARVHLDDTDHSNGCLELALGSHRLGYVATAEAEARAQALPRKLCPAQRGDVLFVKALSLHRSRPSARQTTRRTLRIDYCATDLPPPLRWALELDENDEPASETGV